MSDGRYYVRLLSVLVRAVAVGTLAGLTPLAAILLTRIGFYGCIDTPEFLHITPLVEAGIGVALVTGAAVGGSGILLAPAIASSHAWGRSRRTFSF